MTDRSDVTLVIPGYNAERTVEACLSAVVPLLREGRLAGIVFVDDGSTDRTPALVDAFGVRRLSGPRRGPGAARNTGWQAASTPLVWFIDSDCVAAPDALDRLLARLDADGLDGVGGSYGNMRPDSRLATLIHEEIRERHLAMPREVDFLATFNVVYRRAILEKVGGFDARFLKAQDAELAYRIRRAGGRLGFEADSLVSHYHEDRLSSYLRTQRDQGYWRASLYVTHPDRMAGDGYSGPADHAQPVLAMSSLALVPSLAWGPGAILEAIVLGALVAVQLPMTRRLITRTGRPALAMFAAMSFVRSYARGFGLALGTLHALAHRLRRRRRSRRIAGSRP